MLGWFDRLDLSVRLELSSHLISAFSQLVNSLLVSVFEVRVSEHSDYVYVYMFNVIQHSFKLIYKHLFSLLTILGRELETNKQF